MRSSAIGFGAWRTLHSCLGRPPFALGLSKRPLAPFALSLSKRPLEPFGLSLSKPRGPRALRQAQRERLCAMSAARHQPTPTRQDHCLHHVLWSLTGALEQPR